MRRTQVIRELLTTLLAIGLALPPLLAWAEEKPGDWEGPLVLKVDGKDVTLKIASSSYTLPDEGDTESPTVRFAIDGMGFVLSGEVDLNGDDKLDVKDKPKLDADGGLKPSALLNKRVILDVTHAEDAGVALQNYVELKGIGNCAVLKGSTMTVTNYKKTGREIDRWSGVVKLKLKPEKAQKTLQVEGTFECGIRPEAG
jgi:hypothetical protein